MSSFSVALNKYCKEIGPEYLDRVVRRSVIEITNRLIYRSPVGDAKYWQSPPPPGYAGGRFRANWQYGFNKAPSGDLSTIDPNGSATLSGIIGVVEKGAGTHYIVNNLPYAQRLEDGWSRQAPKGMVKLVELEFNEIVRKAVAEG